MWDNNETVNRIIEPMPFPDIEPLPCIYEDMRDGECFCEWYEWGDYENN